MGDAQTRAAPPREGLRIEDWLRALAEALGAPGFSTALAYDDRFQGERMSLTLWHADGACELQVQRKVRERGARSKETGATLVLLAEADRPMALAHLAERAQALHLRVHRLHNARRRFTHRVALLAQQLQQRRVGLAREAPAEALERLRRLLPQASAMVGVEGRFRGGGDEEDEEEREARKPAGDRAERRYPARSGAWIPADPNGRAAVFYQGTGSFQLLGAAARAAAQALEQRGGGAAEDAPVSGDPAAFAIRNPPAELRGLLLAGAGVVAAGLALEEGGAALGRQRACDGVSLDGRDWSSACDAADCLSSVADLSCDLPDCNSCDLPDLSCDLPSCDL